MSFSFFARYLGELFFLDIWVLKNRKFQIFSENTHTHSQEARQGHMAGALQTRAKIQDLSQKRRGHMDLCAVNVQKSRRRLLIPYVQCRFDFWR